MAARYSDGRWLLWSMMAGAGSFDLESLLHLGDGEHSDRALKHKFPQTIEMSDDVSMI